MGTTEVQDIAAWRDFVLSGFAARWHRMISQWQSPSPDDAVWLMYTASYLFATRGLRWAVDPVRLANRVPEAPPIEAARDLRALNFVLLTHRHADHVDSELWSQLAALDCLWIVPEHMTDLFFGISGLRRSRHLVAVSGREIAIPGARVTPFVSPHGERRPDGVFQHVPATGYRVQIDECSFLFPGGVRTFELAGIEGFEGADVVFAHVFLGRSAALMPVPPLRDAFVDFYLACRSQRVFLTHLYELGREPADCWRLHHAQMIEDALVPTVGADRVTIPAWFEKVPL